MKFINVLLLIVLQACAYPPKTLYNLSEAEREVLLYCSTHSVSDEMNCPQESVPLVVQPGITTPSNCRLTITKVL